jgi:hypothetical protein
MPTLRWTSLALAGAMATAAGVTPALAQQVEILPTAKVKRDKFLITTEEIAARQDLTNAYDVVKFLRPEYFKTTRPSGALAGRASTGGTPSEFSMRPPSRDGGAGSTPASGGTPSRGSGSATSDDGGFGAPGGGGVNTTAILYVDDIRRTSHDELKDIRATDVVEIRYLTGNQAASRYASGHEGGAILVKTKGAGKP